MLSKWLERLRGGSGSPKNEPTEPATAPEPPSMPADTPPADVPPADPGLSDDGISEPPGEEQT